METDKNPHPKPSPERLDQLLKVLQLPVVVAQKSMGKVMTLIFLNVASACWIAYYVMQLVSLSIAWTIAIGCTLALPTLIFCILYYLLNEISNLPEQIQEWKGSVQSVSTSYKQKARLEMQQAELHGRKVKLKEVFSIGKALRDLMSFRDEFDDISDLVTGVVLVGNPLFLILIGIALAVTFTLLPLAIITGWMFIF